MPCNMISEVQVDDERVARELLKVREGKGGTRIFQGGKGGGVIAIWRVLRLEIL